MDEELVTTVTLPFLLRGMWGNTAIILHYVCVNVWESTSN